MSELQIAGSVCILLCTALYGVLSGSEMKRRIVLLRDLRRGLQALRQEITYRKVPMEEAVRRSGYGLQEPIQTFLKETGKKLEELPGENFSRIWNEKLACYLDEQPLKKEDRRLLEQLGGELEMMDAGNADVLKYYEKRLDRMIAGAEEEYCGKGRLYRRLGILGGIFLVILFL